MSASKKNRKRNRKASPPVHHNQETQQQRSDIEIVEEMLKRENPKLINQIGSKNIQKIVTLTKISTGPIPQPEQLDKYNQIIPNGADRIMAMAEKQAEHRISIETAEAKAEIDQSGKGQNYAAIIMLAVIGCGTYLAVNGFPKLGGTMIGGPILGVIVKFLSPRNTTGAK